MLFIIIHLPIHNPVYASCQFLFFFYFQVIGNLKYLTYFDASYNKIDEISNAIGNCVNLTDLTLSSNNLQELPESIGNLDKLIVLRLDENEIKNLPTSIGR